MQGKTTPGRLVRRDASNTTKKWAAITKVSHDTALRDIQNLIEHGILKQDQGGGRSTSYSLVAS